MATNLHKTLNMGPQLQRYSTINYRATAQDFMDKKTGDKMTIPGSTLTNTIGIGAKPFNQKHLETQNKNLMHLGKLIHRFS